MCEFFISDLHLDHSRIIEYSNRPFTSVFMMNAALVAMWQDTVKPQDIVFYLGDLSLGRPAWWWLKRLPGRVVLIKGNHDWGIPTMSNAVISSELGDILLIHKPIDAIGWDGWAIHGHVHGQRPFIDFKRKLVNVSAEAVGYKPVSLESIVGAIKNGRAL